MRTRVVRCSAPRRPVGRVLALLVLGLALAAAAGPAPAQPARLAEHVLLVTLDGARPDGLRGAGIDALLQEAAASMHAQTTVPPLTASAHMSMVSGVGPDRHGVRENDWRPGMPYPRVPTIFSAAKQAGLRAALFTQKGYVRVIADPQYLDRVELVRWRPATLTADLVEATAAYVRAARPHLTLAHISEPDVVGHAEGWMSFAYLQALRRGVAAVGALRQAYRDAGLDGRTVVIVTADHGGIERDHRVVVPEVMTVPWIMMGPGVKRGVALERRIAVYDTAPTILAVLGVPVPPGWVGTVVEEAFEGR
ncbi:MAG: alkaline phosphatase family protein [Armatimonadota bacterium]|nr:alkaline phosphatase family protein [Armatimonadota bacterium]MDR7532687.1 alkaline phosphatase family protein [Armatimonadota bacterium]